MERMLTRRELAERLGVSVDTVDRETAKGAFRVHRIGTVPKYLWSEIVKDTEEQPVSLAQALRRV
jgi:excisionase family DNA binding protein